MSIQNKPFSFPSFRRLWKYMGEADAMIELTELAALSFTSDAAASGNVDKFVATTSKKYGVCVNLPEVTMLHKHLYRHYIVTVYQSAECFLHEFRREHVGLYGKDWKGDANNIDPLTVALRNVSESEATAAEAIGNDLISRFQYYRFVRNWVVHTKESDVSKPQEKYEQIIEYSKDNVERYATVKAPNRPEDLSFDDFIFFSRLTKDLAEKLCEVARPPEEHWFTAFHASLGRFKRLSLNPKRMKNAISGRLRTEYGMDDSTANWIAEELQRQK